MITWLLQESMWAHWPLKLWWMNTSIDSLEVLHHYLGYYHCFCSFYLCHAVHASPAVMLIDFWFRNVKCCLRVPTPLCLPEGLVKGVSVDVAPVLQVDAQAVVTLVGEQVKVLVAQPVFPSRLTKAIPVLGPATVKIQRAVTPTLKNRPTTTWCTHRFYAIGMKINT